MWGTGLRHAVSVRWRSVRVRAIPVRVVGRARVGLCWCFCALRLFCGACRGVLWVALRVVVLGSTRGKWGLGARWSGAGALRDLRRPAWPVASRPCPLWFSESRPLPPPPGGGAEHPTIAPPDEVQVTRLGADEMPLPAVQAVVMEAAEAEEIPEHRRPVGLAVLDVVRMGGGRRPRASREPAEPIPALHLPAQRIGDRSAGRGSPRPPHRRARRSP